MRTTRGGEEKKKGERKKERRKKIFADVTFVLTGVFSKIFCIGIEAQRENFFVQRKKRRIFTRSLKISDKLANYTRDIQYNIIKSPSTVRPRSILSKASKCLPTQRVSYLLGRQSTNNCTRNCSRTFHLGSRIVH